jgi:hypothetical protein
VIKQKPKDKKSNQLDVCLPAHFPFFPLKFEFFSSEQKIRDKEEQKTVWDGGVIPAEAPTT